MAYAALAYPACLTRANGWKTTNLFFALYGELIEIIQPYENLYEEWLDLGRSINKSLLRSKVTISTNMTQDNLKCIQGMKRLSINAIQLGS